MKLAKGLNEEKIKQISEFKNEPEWMLKKRLQGYRQFIKKDMPQWGADLNGIDFEDVTYYASPHTEKKNNWKDVPEDILNTFDKLGIPQAEKKYLAGVATQFESEVVYNKLKKKWNDLGVIYTDCDTGLREHPEIFKKYFGKVIPPHDNKFAALNTAVWSGGSFVYIPAGVKVDIPLQAFFWINAVNMGQFERTLIVAEEGAEVHYVEGCTAPQYSTDSLHAAIVEIYVAKNAKVQYTTIQNWSKNVYNLTTQRGKVEENGSLIWVDANIGSKVTMKYPSVILAGRNSYGEIVSAAVAEEGQHQDTGAKAIHLAEDTKSFINSRSMCKDGGRTSYRGLVKVQNGAKNAKSKIICDALILDNDSQTDTYPYNDIREKQSSIEHEATVSKISEEQLFYLMSRGLSEEEANAMIVAGFMEPVTKELPMEYAAELNALLQMSMEDSVG
jgi:Fe-S cluster assembly protein SufB